MQGGCPTKTAGVLELCIYKLCFKSVKNTQMIKGEFFTALDVSPLCVFLHVLPLSVLFPQGIPHVLDTWQLESKLTWTEIVYCWLQCRYSLM